MKRFCLGLFLTAFLCSTTLLAIQQGRRTPAGKAWVRLSGYPSALRMSRNGRFLAYTDPSGKNLSILELANQKVYKVSEQNVDQSFFWAPDSIRLFYRELSKTKDNKVVSSLAAYDLGNGKNVDLDKFPYSTGFLTYDPRDLRMHLFFAEGLHTRRLYMADERLAQWQIAQRTENGKFVATQKAILWFTNGGYSMQALSDDGSGIQSFDLSPDGTSIVWATNKEQVYVSREGAAPKKLGKGLDPKWHPEKPLILYSAARMIGNKTYDYDLRLVDLQGVGKYLTTTAETKERWPTWHPLTEKVLYTKAETTDLFEIEMTK